jgi:hypothetical protein
LQLLVAGRAPKLAIWEARPFSPGADAGPRAGDKRDHYEREVGDEPPGAPLADGPHARVAAAILRYEIFPPELVTGILRRAPVEVGDTVGIRYRLARGVSLFFGARVIDRFDRAEERLWRTGFTYRTLVGHPELGEETFAVEKDVATGQVLVAFRSWSRPGLALTRAAGPILRRLQVTATARALDHLVAVARG